MTTTCLWLMVVLLLLWSRSTTGSLLHAVLPMRPWAIREQVYHHHHHLQQQQQQSYDNNEDNETRDDSCLEDYYYFEIQKAPQLGSLMLALSSSAITPYILAFSAVAACIGKIITMTAADPSIQRVMYFWKHGGPIIAHYKFTQFWLERVRRQHGEHPAATANPRILIEEAERRHDIYETLHNRYAEPTLQLILNLRGLYVKVGQVLSSRSDFMPRQYLERLAILQDNVPQLPIATVESIVTKSLRSEFGLSWHDVFETMDDVALGSASIGQVHRAVLQKDWFSSHQQQSSSSSSSSSYRGGRVVACKVMHPGAKVCFTRDFSVFRWVCRLVLPSLRPVLDELERRIMTEFDYRNEAVNLQNVRRNMAASPYARRVCVPQPLSELTCENLLVMEMLEGKKLVESIQDGVTQALGGDPALVDKFREYQKRKLLQASSSPIASSSTRNDDGTSSNSNNDSQSADSFIQSLNLKTKLKLYFLRNHYHNYIKLLVRVHGYQVFMDGCFNGDPHPGNTLILNDGRLGLIDYGQTKRLAQEERLAYARIVAAIGNDEHDSHTIANMMRNAGFQAQDNSDNRSLKDYALLFFDSDIEGKRRGYSYPSLYFQSLMSKNPLITIPDSAVFIARSSLLFRGLGSALGTAPVRTAHIWQKHAERAIEMSHVHAKKQKKKTSK